LFLADPEELINSERLTQSDYNGEDVKGSKIDKWNWCKNCAQYPVCIYQKTSVTPPSDFCEQCKTKENNRDCIM